MAKKEIPHVHLKTMEEAENNGCQLVKAGVPMDLTYQRGKSQLGYCRISRSLVCECYITYEMLTLTRYYDFPAQYEQLRALHLCD